MKSSEEKKPGLDLGPFFPKRETYTIPARDDSATIVGNMTTGDPKGGYSTPSGEQVPSKPPVEQLGDTTTAYPAPGNPDGDK